jgi:ferredoxin-NADP reductase
MLQTSGREARSRESRRQQDVTGSRDVRVLVVRERNEVAEGVVTLTLGDPSGAELPSWSAGSHIDLILSDALVRQYSLCSSPADRSAWRIGVLRERESRGGSQFVHERLREGDCVRVRGPRNTFALTAAPRYQFVAGGIGITPILPMLEAVIRAGAEWHLLYGGRSRRSMAFLDELAIYGERVEVRPQDEYGLLDLGAALDATGQDALVYCCGPPALLDAVEERCADRRPGSVRVERFAPRSEQAAAGGDRPGSFDVICKRSGITVTVPAEKSIYDALADAGVEVDSSCLEGTCGTCETKVLEGQPDHRDSLLTESEHEEARVMYVCVSRARSERLVLDL